MRTVNSVAKDSEVELIITGEDENPFNLDDPPVIIKTVEYDPITDRYLVTEMMKAVFQSLITTLKMKFKI